MGKGTFAEFGTEACVVIVMIAAARFRHAIILHTESRGSRSSVGITDAVAAILL